MKQVIMIHGGSVYRTKKDFYEEFKERTCNPFRKDKKRKHRLTDELKETHQTILPEMPNKLNADYIAWKIRFEKHFPFLSKEDTVLIGHSLGGAFLVKWLSENTFPKKIKQLHLVAAVIEHKEKDKRTLGNFKFNFNKIKKILPQVEKIFIYHSKDDPIVPFFHAEKYKKYLPTAKLFAFENRGHLRQEEFPELFENIKSE